MELLSKSPIGLKLTTLRGKQIVHVHAWAQGYNVPGIKYLDGRRVRYVKSTAYCWCSELD